MYRCGRGWCDGEGPSAGLREVEELERRLCTVCTQALPRERNSGWEDSRLHPNAQRQDSPRALGQ